MLTMSVNIAKAFADPTDMAGLHPWNQVCYLHATPTNEGPVPATSASRRAISSPPA